LKLGLGDPLWLQYWRWVKGLAAGDFGKSLLMDRPVYPLITEAFARSLTLTLVAFALIALIGVGLGVLAALRHNGPLDHAVSIGTYLGIAVPEFFWAIVVILVFAATLGWLPASGYEPMSAGFGVWLKHLIAPTLTLVFAHLAHVSRLTRSSMIEVLKSPYVTAARAKGLPERVVVLRHALRNALLPTITVLALDIGRLMGGIVVIETVFAYPGLGRLLVFSVQSRDIPTLQAAILVVAGVYALANLAADLLYAWLNPRIRYGRSVA
jgi:peptide/nickel transport system permease protein